MKSDKLPAMPFYTGDYLKSPNVRSCKPDVRGLYIDCLCLLWNSHERGVFIDANNNPYTEDDILTAIGLDNQNSSNWLTTLIKKGLLLVREPDGAFYNDRMVKDENLRKIRQESGKQGGNPILVNQKPTKMRKEVILFTEDENENKDEDINKKETFEKFWNLYPKRNGKKLGKAICFDWWKKKSGNDCDNILTAVNNYANSETSKTGYARDPIRFLKADWWKEWIEPEAKKEYYDPDFKTKKV